VPTKANITTATTTTSDADAITPVATSTGEDKEGKALKTTAALQDLADTEPAMMNLSDPMNFGRHRRHNMSSKQIKLDHPNGKHRKLKKFYTRQNDLIDQFLGATDEEQAQVEEDKRMAPKIKFAVNASFTVNFCLFIIQMYAAVSTGSLAVNLTYPSPPSNRIKDKFLTLSPCVYSCSRQQQMHLLVKKLIVPVLLDP
jgi:hypothetical protein